MSIFGLLSTCAIRFLIAGVGFSIMGTVVSAPSLLRTPSGCSPFIMALGMPLDSASCFCIIIVLPVTTVQPFSRSCGVLWPLLTPECLARCLHRGCYLREPRVLSANVSFRPPRVMRPYLHTYVRRIYLYTLRVSAGL